MINYFHLRKLRNRKKILENFQRFISQERPIRILRENRNNELSRKITKIVINILQKNLDNERYL